MASASLQFGRIGGLLLAGPSTIAMTLQPNPRDLAEIQKALGRISRSAGPAGMRRVLGRLGLFIRREAQRLLRARRKEWGPSSGRLSRSLAMRLDAASVTVGSNLVYAAVQQFGGTIRPKSGKYLALPVLSQLRRRGVWPRDLPRDSMKFVPNAKIRIGSRSWFGPALIRASDQTEHVTDANGKKRRKGAIKPQGQVMFALVRRVHINGREYLVFSSKAKEFLLADVERELKRVV